MELLGSVPVILLVQIQSDCIWLQGPGVEVRIWCALPHLISPSCWARSTLPCPQNTSLYHHGPLFHHLLPFSATFCTHLSQPTCTGAGSPFCQVSVDLHISPANYRVRVNVCDTLELTQGACAGSSAFASGFPWFTF